MRRNAENLIVLSGAEPPRRWVEPIPLGDVVRGASAEVEGYTRVVVQRIQGLGVSGQAASDVIHLLAELLENAAAFSPPETTVTVPGHPAAAGHVLEIEDRGIGIPPDDLEEINRRLEQSPGVDASLSRRMGLFVVGRLAARYGIKVRLRPSFYGGVTAMVLLPSEILVRLDPGPGDLPVPRASRPMPGDHGRGANRVVRPYAITGGRTQPARADLELEALVFADPSALASADLGDERRAIVLLCAEVMSVAEISARLAIPVGVTRVLLADMVADGLVHLYRPGSPGDRPDLALLERILEGLRSI